MPLCKKTLPGSLCSSWPKNSEAPTGQAQGHLGAAALALRAGYKGKGDASLPLTSPSRDALIPEASLGVFCDSFDNEKVFDSHRIHFLKRFSGHGHRVRCRQSDNGG